MAQLCFSVVVFKGVVIYAHTAAVLSRVLSVGFYQVTCCLSCFSVHNFCTVQPGDSLYQKLLDY